MPNTESLKYAENERTASVKRYCLIFAAAYSAVLVLVNTLNIGMGSGTNIGMALAACSSAAFVFVKDYKRVPSRDEKRKLAGGSLAASILVSALAVAALIVLSDEQSRRAILSVLKSVSPMLAILMALVVSAFYYGFLLLAYGFFSKSLLRFIEQSEIKTKN